MVALPRWFLITASLLVPFVCACSSSGDGSNASPAAAGALGIAGMAESPGGSAGNGASAGALAAGSTGNGGSGGSVGENHAGSSGSDASAGASSAGSSGSNAGFGGSAGASGAAAGNSAGGAGQAGMTACTFTSAEQLLWSDVAPGSSGTTVVEKITERSTDPQVHDRSISGVSKPSLYPYLAAHPNGAAAIILPGGGYEHLAFDKEGVDIANWLNTLGVSAFVLKYRLPTNFSGKPWIPLADAQRALRRVRSAASSCAIDPARIGVVGFSAGGHLASQLATRFAAQTSPASDAIDAIDARPAFAVLMYPVISMDASIAHAGSRTALLGSSPSAADIKLYSSEQQVTSTTPATFIGVSNQDTTVNPQNSIRFDNALKAAAIAEELHLYKDGTHGVGIRDATGDMANWPAQCAAWLTARKLLDRATP